MAFFVTFVALIKFNEFSDCFDIEFSSPLIAGLVGHCRENTQAVRFLRLSADRFNRSFSGPQGRIYHVVSSMRRQRWRRV
jgi:hypothetical protein